MRYSIGIMKASKILLFGGILFLAVSCERGSNFPDEPKISFEEFEYRVVSGNPELLVKISFTDGDGDIGADGINEESLLVDLYEKTNGVFEQVALPDSSLNASFPDLQPKGQNKSLKAEITYRFLFLSSLTRDTIRFDFQLVDRAEHSSNLLQTPEFIIP